MKKIVLTNFVCLFFLSAELLIAEEIGVGVRSGDSLSVNTSPLFFYCESSVCAVADSSCRSLLDSLVVEPRGVGGVTVDWDAPIGRSKRLVVLKSNLFYWAVATPNVAVELPLSDRLSLSAELLFAWWSSYATQFYWQLFSFSPELRYWLRGDRSLQGHYAGVYVGGGVYDVMVKPLTDKRGYQGDYYWSAGLSYGYVFPIGKHLLLEAGVSVGYMESRYREYIWSCSEYMRIDTKRTTWVGPTKINLTLVWQLPR